MGTLKAQSSTRTIVSINEVWQFTKDAYNPDDTTTGRKVAWQTVTLPHTWNTTDVMDDVPGYYRSVGWYRKQLSVDTGMMNKIIYLHFEGVNQEATVYVNGKYAGSHTGGYNAFVIPVQHLLKFGTTNEIVVKADNSFNRNIPPLSADFTFYGGIYRDVWLEAYDKIHFARTDHASQGVYLTTPAVNEEKAAVRINGLIDNKTGVAKKVKIITTVYDKAGKITGTIVTAATLKPNTTETFVQNISSVVRPHLWSPEDPYLYKAVTRITDASGLLLDEVINPLGFRWFSFDTDKGFFLNGKPCKLVGASRHQDYEGMGNAVPDELAREDVKLLKQMGGNFLRVAHYPQDPAVLQACDEMGILASVEIPVVNEVTETDTFYRNCAEMQVEMIRQNYNHPSVVIWCYMNEVLLKPHYGNDKVKQQAYFANITTLAKQLDSITRKEDPYRYTMLACHGDFDKYRSTGLTAIPMIVGWNLYSGWYGGVLSDFEKFLDRHHKELPDKPLIVTEYGADADPRIRSFKPVRFDKSVEYATDFHRHYLDAMLERSFVAGALIWNLADFNSETRTETMPHINNKGLMMWNRTPKDVYLWHQAVLLKQPFVAIASAYWNIRSGVADSIEQVCYQPLQVTSNLDSITLLINGKALPAKKVTDGICEWLVPFANGANQIEAWGMQQGRKISAFATIDFRLQPYTLRDERIPFHQLNVLLGANRYYIDDTRKQVWIPDQPYRPGSWGYMGGQAFNIPGSTRLPYGTDKGILGTDDDPIYQTQQTGIQEYCLDVPDGVYELTLHFAELQGGMVPALAYNLSSSSGGSSSRKESSAARVFDVLVNNVPVLQNFNIAAQYGLAKAVARKVPVTAANNKGIRIVFNATEGEAVLNALQVVKIY
ncbi:MAG: glycoside hydrolase family 2 TIM barrel-domain containing protein [Chitinophagaceae bacterium]